MFQTLRYELSQNIKNIVTIMTLLISVSPIVQKALKSPQYQTSLSSFYDFFLQHVQAQIFVDLFQAQTSLFVAVKNRHLRCVQLLLHYGANPNGDLSCLCTPLYVAAMDGNLAAVQVCTFSNNYARYQFGLEIGWGDNHGFFKNF